MWYLPRLPTWGFLTTCWWRTRPLSRNTDLRILALCLGLSGGVAWSGRWSSGVPVVLGRGTCGFRSGRSSGVRWDAVVGLAVLGQDRVRVGDGPVQSQATTGLHVPDCPPGAAVRE